MAWATRSTNIECCTYTWYKTVLGGAVRISEYCRNNHCQEPKYFYPSQLYSMYNYVSDVSCINMFMLPSYVSCINMLTPLSYLSYIRNIFKIEIWPLWVDAAIATLYSLQVAVCGIRDVDTTLCFLSHNCNIITTLATTRVPWVWYILCKPTGVNLQGYETPCWNGTALHSQKSHVTLLIM